MYFSTRGNKQQGQKEITINIKKKTTNILRFLTGKNTKIWDILCFSCMEKYVFPRVEKTEKINKYKQITKNLDILYLSTRGKKQHVQKEITRNIKKKSTNIVLFHAGKNTKRLDILFFPCVEKYGFSTRGKTQF